MLSKSLANFLLMGGAVFPPCYLTLGQITKYGGGNEDNGNLLQKVPSCTAAFSTPNPAAGHHQPTPQLETPRHSQASLGQTLVGSLILSLGSCCTRSRLCPSRVYFLVLCKFWQLSLGVNGDLYQEGLCHTRVCCTQSPCPCGRPLLTHTSSGDAQKQFHLCLCRVPGS